MAGPVCMCVCVNDLARTLKTHRVLCGRDALCLTTVCMGKLEWCNDR